MLVLLFLLLFVFLLLFLLLSKGPCDFMKRVTRMASKSHPGNKFHEIIWAYRVGCCQVLLEPSGRAGEYSPALHVLVYTTCTPREYSPVNGS